MKDIWQKIWEFSGDILDAKVGPINEAECFDIMMKTLLSPHRKAVHDEYTDLFYKHNEKALLLRTRNEKPILFFPVLEKGEEILRENVRVRNIEEMRSEDGFVHSAIMYISYKYREPFFVFVPFYPEIKNKIMPFQEYPATIEMIVYDISLISADKYKGAEMKQLHDRRKIFYEIKGEVVDIKYKETVIESIMPIVVERKDYERMGFGKTVKLIGALCAYFRID